jgi:hypothetical protein
VFDTDRADDDNGNEEGMGERTENEHVVVVVAVVVVVDDVDADADADEVGGKKVANGDADDDGAGEDVRTFEDFICKNDEEAFGW